MDEKVYYLVFSDEWGIIKSYEYKVDSNKTISTATVQVEIGPTIEGNFQIMWKDPHTAPREGTIQMYGKHRAETEWFLIHSLEGVAIYKTEGEKMFFRATELVWDESIDFSD